jgi:2-polyprenyl-6-methoxyphenol hydroxylase-like FAD-dependent oxidoreductase
MGATESMNRFMALPDEQTLAVTAAALEEHGFSVDVADDLDEARGVTLARIPRGSSVMTNTSVTLEETGIAEAVNGADSVYESARNKMLDLQAAHERVHQHSLKLEDARAQAAYGQHSSIGKILEIHQDLPGRVHIVLVRRQVGY